MQKKKAQTRVQASALKKAGDIKKQVIATSGITEKQITTFNENKDRIVSVKDVARINAVLKRDLSVGEIKNYCKAVFEAPKRLPLQLEDANADPNKQIGLLALEGLQVYPELVKENTNGKPGVNYEGMVPVLLQAIKEQQKQIEELKRMVKLLNEKYISNP